MMNWVSDFIEIFLHALAQLEPAQVVMLGGSIGTMVALSVAILYLVRETRRLRKEKSKLVQLARERNGEIIEALKIENADLRSRFNVPSILKSSQISLVEIRAANLSHYLIALQYAYSVAEKLQQNRDPEFLRFLEVSQNRIE